MLPPFAPGEKSRESPAALLRNYAQQAEASLTRFGASAARIDALLEPLEHLAADPAIGEGFHWSRAILRSPEVFEEFLLRQPHEGSVLVADRFHLLPLVAEAELPPEFYLLKLSKKRATLEAVLQDVRAGMRVQAVKLPRMAETLDEFLALDKPDHDRENRMAGGGTRQILFGTGSERETQHAHLGDYYKHVEQALAAFIGLKNGVVVPVGVEEDTALYRSVAAGHTYLSPESIGRSPDDGVPEPELLRRALDLVHGAVLARNRAACQSARERLAPGRYSENPEAITEMAAVGRVARLYVAQDARDENLNLALIDTLLHSGEAHALPAGSPAAVVLRY